MYHEKGILKWNNGSSYIGEFKDNKFHGIGTIEWLEGIDFIDIISVNDFKEGLGNYNNNYSWTGQFKDGNIKKK